MKADVWSFGILYFRIINGYFPFSSEKVDKKELFKNILKQELEFPKNMRMDDRYLLSLILNKCPNERILFGTIVHNLRRMV